MCRLGWQEAARAVASWAVAAGQAAALLEVAMPVKAACPAEMQAATAAEMEGVGDGMATKGDTLEPAHSWGSVPQQLPSTSHLPCLEVAH